MAIKVTHIYSDGSISNEIVDFLNDMNFVENVITTFIILVLQSDDVANEKIRARVRSSIQISKHTKRLFICTGDDVHFFE